jgi:LPXTG-site transpeptidase (sortase) family protein
MTLENRPGNPQPGTPPEKRLPLPIVGALGGAIVVGLIIFVIALAGGGGGEEQVADPSAISGGLKTDEPEPTPEATIDLARPTVEAVQHLTSVGPDDRMIIAKFGVEAPLTYRQVGLDGIMPNPEGADDVAYYDFSQWQGKGGAPGKGGNAVFAGHVDSGSKPCKNGTVPPPCTAVFWDISQMRIGDEIELKVSGVSHKYRVVSNEPVSASTGPWDQIVSATAQESITLITCGGDFNRVTREYNNRQVLVAVRV